MATSLLPHTPDYGHAGKSQNASSRSLHHLNGQEIGDAKAWTSGHDIVQKQQELNITGTNKNEEPTSNRVVRVLHRGSL